MDLTLQPKPEVQITRADQGIVTKREYFVEKEFEEINQYCFPAHFIRNWRPKAELLYSTVSDENSIQYECDFNRGVQNCFVEDYAEEVFLRTPPPCFVVIGKVHASVNKLGQDIAREYGSVLIQVDKVIDQVIQTETETSKFLNRILRLGVSLTLNFILPLLSFLAHTPEARHRGYVLCGLPRIPEVCDLSAEQQFNYIFSWDNKPTVFINVLFDDEDLIKERTNQRCETKNEENGNILQLHIRYDESSEDEEEVDPDEKDLLPIKEERAPSNIDIDISPSRPWARLPTDEESQVWSELELFNVKLKPAIELITSRIDPQYFITVDSRVQNEFEIVRARLSLLQVWKSPLAFPFITSRPKTEISDEEKSKTDLEGEENFETDPEILSVINHDPRVAFLTLFKKKTLSPKFRWELSHYNYICPVSLRESEVVEGKSAYAVSFMKYIYFLRNEECMTKFLRNPRAYVLPIRPKPLCRFIFIGYPFTGKTTLAHFLAEEFSIPLLDLKTILKEDTERKKNMYRNFCKQKAECREILRLTNLAWQDWRMEEERRVNLIENWIMYIQSLLNQRITQFYTPEPKEEETKAYSSPGSIGNIEMHGEEDAMSGESGRVEGRLEVQGVTINLGGGDHPSQVGNQSTTSAKIIKAIKHEDFDFHENSMEVEANLFFSSLWNGFSNKRQERSETASVESEEGEALIATESMTIDWYKLLPPQSLSTLLLSRRPYTVREKRESFQVLLEAASKNYWTPNSLKEEFAKWRLPCFMDIPLCEIFFDNPILLLKYIPEWLKERPAIPDPIDAAHPSVVEAGDRAFMRANVVKISQNKEEVAILIRDAIEKAERKGMRVTGEVISPGGWVLDNMTLDIDVWKKLACENILADHIYILIDPDPEYKRILSKWCDICCPPSDMSITESDESSAESEEDKESVKSTESRLNLYQILKENLEAINQNEEELDKVFAAVQNESDDQIYRIQCQVDPLSHGILYSISDQYKVLKVESIHEEFASSILLHSDSTSILVAHQKGNNLFIKVELGSRLQVFTNELMKKFEAVQEVPEEKKEVTRIMRDELGFFINLLTLPQKLDQIVEFLTTINRGQTITEIDITDKDEKAVFTDIRNELMEPFIKKPRELEDFEISEIRQWTNKDNAVEEDKDEKFETKEENEEDIRIFGEAGSLCVVNLERNILLPGKLEFAMRYYGKLYYFWNEDAKSKFIEDPEKYAPYYSVIRCYPPLRVFVMGPIGSGKTDLCHAIADQFSLNYVDYLTLLNKNLVPNLPAPCEKLTALGEHPLLLRNEDNAPAKEAREKFMRAPVSQRIQLLESPFYWNSESEKDLFSSLKLSKNKIPTAFPELSYQCIELSPGNDSYDLPPPPPFISMKEIELLLNGYLQNESDLNDYCIQKSLKKLWECRPFITEGFVLEGFPMRAFDVQRILDNNWYPDVIIQLSLPENVLVERNTDLMMDLWELKLKQESVEEKLLQNTLDMIQRSCKWSRRDELMLAKIEGVAEKYENDELSEELAVQNFEDDKKSRPSIPVPLEVEAEIIKEVDQIIEEEFPQLEFRTVFETYEAGKARLLEDLVKNYRRDVGEINEIKNLLEDTNVDWFEVSSENDYETNRDAIFQLLNKVRKRIGKKGEFAFTMKMEMAEELLQHGYYFLSKFGRWCPVQVYRLKNSIHMYRPLTSREKVTPIAYRNYIYFVAGKNEKKLFLEDPVKYTFNEPHHPNIPLRVAVIGPPKTGKSTLSSRLGLMFGLKVVTMGTALRFVVECIPHSTLAKKVNCYLRRGCFLPLSLKIEALMACLNDPDCITQGFVLDGIPFDAALTQSLAERGKLPFVIVSLTADADFGKTNRQNLFLPPFRLPYKNRVNMDMRYKDWNESYKKFFQWNQLTYNNLYEVNAKLNVVDIFYQSYDIIRKSLFGILYYVEYCVSDKVLPLQYLCVSQHEYELRKSALGNNCPVCWVEMKCFSSTRNPPERSGLVQYLANFYWVCPDHMKKFVKAPKIYLPPRVNDWPQLLPKMITKEMYEAMFPRPKIHGYGRCPVTRIDFPVKLDWEGSWDFATLYSDEVFLCKNKKMLDRFLARPWNYNRADTVFEVDRPEKSKAVQELEPPVITSLPAMGFLEQTIASFIVESLQIVGSIRPIYPNVSMDVTGCVLLALLLKSRNTKTKSCFLIKECLDFMMRNCEAYVYYNKQLGGSKEEMKDIILTLDHRDSTELECIEEGDRDEEGGSCSQISLEPYRVDIESQGDKQMWTAKMEPLHTVEMYLTPGDELLEIPFYPKAHVILKYQTYLQRRCPLPPIRRCLTYIYSTTRNMRIPEPFNYNTLYQPSLLFVSPYPKEVVFNPDTELSRSLYKETTPNPASKECIYKGQRAYPVRSAIKFVKTDDPNYDMKLVLERYMPRFQFLDKMPLVPVPPIPEVVDEETVFFNPQRDYTYMMLYAEFFHMSHVLRCYEWSELDRYMELDTRLSKNIGSGFVYAEIFRRPRKQPSIEMKRSIDFYHDLFDATGTFVLPPQEEVPDEEGHSGRKSTLINFIQMIIMEKVNEIFDEILESDLSYESFESVVVESNTEVNKSTSIIIREIIPYPPLRWDIICRPYFAYSSIDSIFNVPSLDNIAHEKHFALLDGVELTREKIRFIRYPSWLQFGEDEAFGKAFDCMKRGVNSDISEHLKASAVRNSNIKAPYFFFDYFHLPWTSFLTYPFCYAYNEGLTSYFQETDSAEMNDRPSQADLNSMRSLTN